MKSTKTEEKWMEIDGYEGRYLVSDKGRIGSFVGRSKEFRILTPRTGKRDLYQRIRLSSQTGEVKEFTIHRLVMNAFSPNPDPEHLTQINHKDENPANNCLENLEWCSPKYNSNYGHHNENIRKGMTPYLERKRANKEQKLKPHIDAMSSLKSRSERVDYLETVKSYRIRNELMKKFGLEGCGTKFGRICARATFEQNLNTVLDDKTSPAARKRICQIIGIQYDEVNTKTKRRKFHRVEGN